MIEIIGALTFRALFKTLFSCFTWPLSSNDIAIFTYYCHNFCALISVIPTDNIKFEIMFVIKLLSASFDRMSQPMRIVS